MNGINSGITKYWEDETPVLSESERNLFRHFVRHRILQVSKITRDGTGGKGYKIVNTVAIDINALLSSEEAFSFMLKFAADLKRLKENNGTHPGRPENANRPAMRPQPVNNAQPGQPMVAAGHNGGKAQAKDQSGGAVEVVCRVK
jgi:hypothetical protein